MTEDQGSLEPSFRAHHLKGQQGSKRLASTWAGVDQHISPGLGAWIQPSAQQLNQLLLPLPRPNGLAFSGGSQSEGRCGDGGWER